MKLKIIAALSIIAIAGTGCATRAVMVTESDGIGRPLTSKLEAQDIRATVEKMAESLISDPGVLEATNGERPILDIEPVQNRSQMIVDVRALTDSIRMRLIRSRLFKFVDRSTSGADITIMDEQAQLGLTDRTKAIRGGKQSAAQMYLTGAISEITTKSGRVTDRYYKFSMILKDLRSGEIVWADEKEVRKVSARGSF